MQISGKQVKEAKKELVRAQFIESEREQLWNDEVSKAWGKQAETGKDRNDQIA